MSGWSLTGRLISKHFSNLGDKLAEAIASFDPETATEADRDRIAVILREAATKLAGARRSFDKEHQDVVKLRSLIASDIAVAEKLTEKLAAGEISEAAVTTFCDELEANKARLPNEELEEQQAKEFYDELQKVVDVLSKQLTDFDAQAKKVKQSLQMAQSQKQLQELRISQQGQLDSYKGLSTTSTALSALTRKSERLSQEAEGLKTVADIGQKPIDQAAEINAIRKSVTAGAAESPAERLARLTGKTATTPA